MSRTRNSFTVGVGELRRGCVPSPAMAGRVQHRPNPRNTRALNVALAEEML